MRRFWEVWIRKAAPMDPNMVWAVFDLEGDRDTTGRAELQQNVTSFLRWSPVLIPFTDVRENLGFLKPRPDLERTTSAALAICTTTDVDPKGVALKHDLKLTA